MRGGDEVQPVTTAHAAGDAAEPDGVVDPTDVRGTAVAPTDRVVAPDPEHRA